MLLYVLWLEVPSEGSLRTRLRQFWMWELSPEVASDLHAQARGRGGGGALGGRGRLGSGRRAGPRPQPYNRNKFLQANFRFLVSDAADLRRHEADADLMLDWDDVVQARP
jgi:hypothetical protein